MLNILLIGSKQKNHALINRVLSDKFQLSFALDEKTGIDHALQNKTDIILLDQESFGNLYVQICTHIKSVEQLKNIPLLLLTENTSIPELIQGLDAGADNYVTKPYDADQLLAKTKITLKFIEERLEKDQQIQEAHKMAYTAMTDNSELGWVIQFIEQNYSINSYEGLADAIFNITNNLKLSCLLFIDAVEKEYFFSSNGLISPLEKELIFKLSKKSRFFDFNHRTQINYSNVSLLVKNMPLADDSRYGRLKDLLPNILRSSEAKIKHLDAQYATSIQTNKLNQSFVLISETLNEIKLALHASQEKGIEILRNMLLEVDHDIPRMGLEEDQEMFILGKIDAAIDEVDNSAAASLQITHSFDDVITHLQHLVDMQEHIQSHLNDPVAESDITNPGEPTMDIELF